jgi:hypothetical protein
MSEPHIAGHSTHFLRRLARLDDEQVEVALTLYRDRDLLKEVLGKTSIGAAAERVAISLDDPREGPFVVVTRRGDYVTCLGRGMRTGEIVVTREELEAASARVERMRERLAAARSLVADGGGEATRLFRRLKRSGPYLAREDFDALARWEPILATSFVDLGLKSHARTFETCVRLAALRPDRMRTAEDLLESWWFTYWTFAHATVLMNVGDARSVLTDVTSGMTSDRNALHEMTKHTLYFGPVSTSARALWAVGKHGRALVDEWKREASKDGPDVFRGLAFATIAHSSKKLRSKAVRALGSMLSAAHPGERNVGRDLHAIFSVGPELSAELYDDLARASLAGEWTGRDDLPVRVTSASDVPVEVARAACASSPRSWRADRELLTPFPVMTAWLARAQAGELFLPRPWARSLSRPYTIDQGLDLLASLREAFGIERPATVRRIERIGRNERCPCGSGKKYKRCCGARAAVACAA